MKREQSGNISFREALKFHYRAFKLLNGQCPKMFLSCAVASVCISVTPYAGIYLSAKIINELAGNRNPEVLRKLVLITLATTSALTLLSALLSRWKDCKSASFWHNKNKLFADKMMDMDFCSLDKQNTHDLHSQIVQNERWGGWGLFKVIAYFESIVRSTMTILGAITLTVSLFTLKIPATSKELTALNHPLFAVAVIIALLLTIFITPLFANKANSYWIKCAEDAKSANRFFFYFGYLSKDRHRALDIRIYNQQSIANHYIQNTTGIFESPISNYAIGPMGALNALASVTSIVFTGIVYLFVCLKAWAGAFGIGSVTQYIGAITALSQGFSSLLTTIGDMRNNAAFLRTAFEFLDIPNHMYQGSLTTEKRSDRNYEVEFCNVSFRYPGAETYALRHVSFKFKVGQRLAVVGMNGSGKTTFIKLLCRLYDPTEGVILLNGIDIRKYRYDDYMSVFSVVFQDFNLLSFPLGQNVAAGMNYDNAKVLDCLNKSGFAQNPAKMPDGTDTCLYRDFDEKGVEVSGGEAQKIAIARALYKDAPFIILDEPTAALDPIAEAEIYTKFNEIVGDKTAIYISHRLSSCRFCDDIIVFHEGSMVQQGSHDRLVTEQNGKYYELWQAQAQYYNK